MGDRAAARPEHRLKVVGIELRPFTKVCAYGALYGFDQVLSRSLGGL